MRRLPIFFLVDVSESMVGDSLTQLEEAFHAIVQTLRQDPYALETAHVCVIAFAGRARTLLPLTEIISFYPPELPVGGGTALGGALNHLMDEIDRQVVKTSPQSKGDWKPTVFLITDGHPTDDTHAAVARWNQSYRDRANLVAVSVGGQADHTVLKSLTGDVIVFYDAAPDAFARFAKWISMSIQTQSRSVSTGKEELMSLAKQDSELLSNVDSVPGLIDQGRFDPRYAVFVGRCQQNKMPYIVKYEKHNNRLEVDDPFQAQLMRERAYLYQTVIPVKNSYFDFTDNAATQQTINSGQLIGVPECPYCGAASALAVCSCERIHCVSGGGQHVCPWCGDVGFYEMSDGDSGSGGFEIGRGRG